MAQSFKRAEIEEEQVVQVEKSNCLIRRKREAVVWCGVFWLSSYCLPSMIWAGQPQNDLPQAKGEICSCCKIANMHRWCKGSETQVSERLIYLKFGTGNGIHSTTANQSIRGSKRWPGWMDRVPGPISLNTVEPQERPQVTGD